MYEMILKVYHTTSSVSILCAVLFQTDLTVQQLRGHPRAFVAAMTQRVQREGEGKKMELRGGCEKCDSVRRFWDKEVTMKKGKKKIVDNLIVV